MVAVLADVVLHHKSGLPRDSVVNSFAFATVNPLDDLEAGAIRDDLASFYNTIPSGHNAIAGTIGSQISRTIPVDVKLYDLTGHLDGTAHGSPRFVKTFTLGPRLAGATDLPSELCAALSFRADYATDAEFAAGARPRARDRGRIYIGPLTQTTLTQDSTTGRVNFVSVFRETLATQGAALRDAPGRAWSVWSRRNAVLEPVTVVWADDAVDIQRRRGEAPTTRTTG